MKNKKGLVPNLRFPEFRDAGTWEEKPLGYVYSFKVTNSFSRDKLNYEIGTVKNIHYGDIHTKFSALFDIEKELVPFINQDQPIERIKPENYCKEGDVIFADASEDLDDVGKAIEIINLNGEKLLSGLHTILARQINSELAIRFGAYLFASGSIRKKIKKEAQGAKVLGISGGRLSGIDICYPKQKAEQQKIADCLASLDALITAEAQKIEQLKTHKKGLMQQLFPAPGETLPKLRFPEFRDAGAWEEKTIGQLTSVTAGGTPTSTNEQYWGGDIPWMNSGELNNKRVYSVSNRITSLGLRESSTKLIPPFCVLIGLAGQGKTRGTAAINYIELCTNQSIAAIHPNNDEFDSHFLYHKLDSMYDHLRSISKGDGGRGGLNLHIIKSIKIPFPTIREQQKIADCLSSIDALITAQTQKLDQLKTHKKGLMQQLFPTVDEVGA